MGTGKRGAFIAAFIAIVLFVITPSVTAEGGSPTPSLSPAKGPYDLGVIFSASDLLLGLESYQAGLGAKIGWRNLCLRGLFDFTVNGSSESLAVNVGATGEYHPFPGLFRPTSEPLLAVDI